MHLVKSFGNEYWIPTIKYILPYNAEYRQLSPTTLSVSLVKYIIIIYSPLLSRHITLKLKKIASTFVAHRIQQPIPKQWIWIFTNFDQLEQVLKLLFVYLSLFFTKTIWLVKKCVNIKTNVVYRLLDLVGKIHYPDILMLLSTQARLWACGRGDVSTPSFGSHLNPISTRGGRLCPPYTGVHTKFWKPQARL